MAELLALADDESPRPVAGPPPGLHRIERPPAPAGRDRRPVREPDRPDDVLVFSGAEEAIFCLLNVAVGAGRPRDRDLAGLPEPVRGGPRRPAPRSASHELHQADGWALDVERIRLGAPAGDPDDRRQRAAQPDRDAADPRRVAGADRAVRRGPASSLFADEVYRFLEYDEADRLPAGADALPTGISLGVMSKSFAMAGLRIGWLATPRPGRCSSAARRSRTTPRSAPRPRPRS